MRAQVDKDLYHEEMLKILENQQNLDIVEDEASEIIQENGTVVAVKLAADGILRGSGMMNRFMISTFTDLILRVTLASMLSKTVLGSVGIWCAWPIGWTVASVLSVLFYCKGPWMKQVPVVEE